MIKKNCPVCGNGKLKPTQVPYEVYGVKLGDFSAHLCNECNEEWFDEKTSKEIEKIEKEKGLFGLSKKSKISYSGNSLMVRIPEQIAKFMHLKKENDIIIHPEGKNKFVVEIEA